LASPIAGTIGGYAALGLLLASLLFLLLMRGRRRPKSNLPERVHPAAVVTSFLRSEDPLPRKEVLRSLEALRSSRLTGGKRLALSVLALRFLARGPLADAIGRRIVRWALRVV
jgi:hypothetical protein